MNLNQITLPVLNVERAIDFYTNIGLQLIVHTHDGYARLYCEEGGSTLSVHKVDKLPFGERIKIYFERDDLDEYVNKLVKNKIVIDMMPKDQTWLWREAYLRDPDGNPIVIYSAGENRVNPPWKYKGS